MKKKILVAVILAVAVALLAAIGITVYKHIDAKNTAMSIMNVDSINITINSEFTFEKADKIVSWVSSDESILSVKDGKLRPYKTGTVTVTGFDKKSKTHTCEVVIYPLHVKKNSAGCYTVSGSGRDLENIHIPAYIEGIPVTEISAFAFNGYESIKTLTIEEGINKIGSAAFAFCTSLESIEIPKSVKVLSDNVFLNCTSLNSIILPASIESIGEMFVEGCTDIKLINYRGSYNQWSKIKIAKDFPSDLKIVYNYSY
jgi:hypothetical protein